MKIRLIGFACIITGGVVLASLLFHDSETKVYVYPSGANENAVHEVVRSTQSKLLVNGCEIPHKIVSVDVSEVEAKKLREEAGYSSEGVTGGTIVKLEETGTCP